MLTKRLGLSTSPCPAAGHRSAMVPGQLNIMHWRSRPMSWALKAHRTAPETVALPAAAWGLQEPSSVFMAKSKPGKTTSSLSKQRSVQGKLKGGGGDDDDPGWGWLDPSRYQHRWDVPWGLGTTTGGMALWFLSFIAVGIIALPSLAKYAGIDLSSMSMTDKAGFTLACQAAETLVGLAVIRIVTVKPMDAAPAPEDPSDQLFRYSLSEPFKAPYGWAAWALIGVLLSPAVVGLTATVVSSVGYDNVVGGKGTVDGVVGMIDVDMASYLSLLGVTGALAPVLEETVFRGFLLTSLTKFMPTWSAVGLSSLCFGLAHLSPRDLPVLVALGCLLGFSYVRSRNLLTPIIIHGAWNSTVLTLLFGLAASGIDVETALREMR